MKICTFQTPTSQESWEEISRGFYTRWNFPNCIGALDGKHVRLTCPANSGSLYHNYKGSFSIVMLALVDSDYVIRYVDIGSEGRVADGGIWRSCSFQRWLRAHLLNIPPPKAWPNDDQSGPMPYTIVADDAFAMSRNLLKPYSSRALTHDKRIFNYRLSRARRVSENVFGILSNRFRLLLTNIYRSPDRAVDICRAVACLHNYLRRESATDYIGVGNVDIEDANHGITEGDWRRNVATMTPLQPTRERNPTTEAKEIRDAMASYFTSDAGSVPWQDAAIN